MKLKNIIFWGLCFQRGGCDISHLTGRWKSPLDTSDTSYFQVKESAIFAIRPDAKVSMDIRNIKKNNNIIELEMDNLKVHHAPLYLNVFDFRVLRFVRHLMKHGLTLEFSTLPNSTVVVNWRVEEKNKDIILQQGNLCLSKCPHIVDDC